MLPVTLAGVKLLCGIGDTSQDAAVSALIALAQPALEYALDPGILARAAGDPGLAATLTLGATECLAGAYLATLGRAPLAAQTFRLSTLEIATRPVNDLAKLGDTLAAAGLARLQPFARSARSLARTAAGSDAALDDQAPVPLLIGTGMAAGVSLPVTGALAGPPADSDFDAVLGAEGRTDPPGGDLFSPGAFGFFTGGPEP